MMRSRRTLTHWSAILLLVTGLAAGCGNNTETAQPPPAPSFDPAPNFVALRGTIEAADAQGVRVRTADGVKDAAADDRTGYARVSVAALQDIKANEFVGITAQRVPEGLRALEVHIFPESMRGTGEGPTRSRHRSDRRPP